MTPAADFATRDERFPSSNARFALPMPITEVSPSSPSPSSPPPEAPFRRKRVRYEELDPEELFHVIDDLEGSKTRGRIREFIWISIIAHMLVFWYIAYGPRYFPQIRVVNPADKIKKNDKDISYLDLPETKRPRSKITEPNRPAAPPATRKMPAIDRKTLEDMRKAEPVQQPTPPAPQPPQPQVAQQQPQPPTGRPRSARPPAARPRSRWRSLSDSPARSSAATRSPSIYRDSHGDRHRQADTRRTLQVRIT
jgi:hypothetical protein